MTWTDRLIIERLYNSGASYRIMSQNRIIRPFLPKRQSMKNVKQKDCDAVPIT